MYKGISLFRIFNVIVFSLLFVYPNPQNAKDPARIIAGWVEKIRIENIEADIKAKLDTGARTSSIYATDIIGFKKDGKRWVKFTLQLTDSKNNQHQLTLERPRTRKTNIKSHDGEPDKRYVVDLQICFNGRLYTTEFTLANRSEYIYDILLGRQFLRKTAIIDPAKTFLTLAKCNL